MSVPLGILLVLVMAVAPALRWSRQAGLGWLMALTPGFVCALLAFAGALFTGVKEGSHLALIATTGFALGINTWMTVKLFCRGWSYGAGYLGHAGLAVMILGMVMSTALGRTERLTLNTGETGQALGYTLTYRGDRFDLRGGHELDVLVTRKGWSFEARPQLLKMPQGEGSMHKPAISGRRELYLSPVDVKRPGSGADELVWLPQGEPVPAGGATWTFVGFRMESQAAMQVFADIDVSRGVRTERVSPGLRADAQGTRPLPVEVAGLGLVTVGRIDADRKRVGVMRPGAGPVSQAVLEFSTKPLVNLVWVGALLTLLGAALAGLRRAIDVVPGARGRRAAAPAAPVAPATGGLQ
jgi:cytochrome c-type biogenesis protein CcmF